MSINRWISTGFAAGVLGFLAPPAQAVTYCTVFNDAFLTQILTDSDSCASYPCNFYTHDFGDAEEECGDELFRVAGPAGTPANCDFCFWSACGTVLKSELLVVPVDEVGKLQATAAFRHRVLTAPGAQTIFRGDGDGQPPDTSDNPPFSTTVPMIAGRDYLFVLVQGHTRVEAIADPTVPVFYSIAGANPDHWDHLVSLVSAQNSGAVAFAWEDLAATDPVWDNDLNDVVYTTRCALEIRPSRLPRTPHS